MQASKAHRVILQCANVFDGENVLHNISIVVVGDAITRVAKQTEPIENADQYVKYVFTEEYYVLPGLIEGHGHLFLHAYNETTWNDQVLKEPRSMRAIRAGVHAQKTLEAGFTTFRDLGTEGCYYDDVGVKKSIEQGIITGPRLLICTQAIVAASTYGPRGFDPQMHVHQGAEEVSGCDEMLKAVRTQISKGADFIKVYVDQSLCHTENSVCLTVAEIKTAVDTAKQANRYVAAHAFTHTGINRCIEGGVRTIEHGDFGTEEDFIKMHKEKIAYCPTVACTEAYAEYNGWKKGLDPDPWTITQKKKSFTDALKSGVTILCGGDVGVFPHGDNARELELLVEYGMTPKQALQAATINNGRVFYDNGYHLLEKDLRFGELKPDYYADIIAVKGNPLDKISDVRKICFVMKEGVVFSNKL